MTMAETSSAATVNGALTIVRTVLREAWRLKLMSTGDYLRVSSIESIIEPVKLHGRFVSPEELAPIFEACAADSSRHGARDAAILATLYVTGMRSGELRALDLADYNRVSGKFTIRRSKTGPGRVVFASSEAQVALANWIKMRGRWHGPLFCTLDRYGGIRGNRFVGSEVSKILRKRIKAAGAAHFSPHDLRRSFITTLLAIGIDVLTVQKLVGHAVLTSTALYDHRGEKEKKEACDQMKIPLIAPRRLLKVQLPDTNIFHFT